MHRWILLCFFTNSVQFDSLNSRMAILLRCKQRTARKDGNNTKSNIRYSVCVPLVFCPATTYGNQLMCQIFVVVYRNVRSVRYTLDAERPHTIRNRITAYFYRKKLHIQLQIAGTLSCLNGSSSANNTN